MDIHPETAADDPVARVRALCRPANMDGWHLLRSTSEQIRNGYSTQTMDLWDASGRHLAAGRQLIAIFI